MPTPINLVESIAKRIENIVGLYRYAESDNQKAHRAPRVFRQYLLEKKYDDQPDYADYPLVCVSLGELETQFDARPIAQVLITCGAYDDGAENQGWQLPTEIAYRIMVDLQQNPVIGPFSMGFPLTLGYPEEQPKPQWLAFVYTRWSLPEIERTTPTGIYAGMFGEAPPQTKIKGI